MAGGQLGAETGAEGRKAWLEVEKRGWMVEIRGWMVETRKSIKKHKEIKKNTPRTQTTRLASFKPVIVVATPPRPPLAFKT